MSANFCAIDFGTSNSALALPRADAMFLAQLEPGFTSMPTAVFYAADHGERQFGRAAIAAYTDGSDGRLMRSIKSILGSDLMDKATEVAPGYAIRYVDVVIAYLRHLRAIASRHGPAPTRAVIGRPVFFVDDDAKRDAQAQATLDFAARAAGFEEVAFQFEPIAAALDFESRLATETLVLVADIGGGTSDFSLVRASPARHSHLDRRTDILANHGVHVAGTDFDRVVNLAAIMPLLGYGSRGIKLPTVPSSIYFELATWHLINTTYAPNRIAELRQMRAMYEDERAHARLLAVLVQRLGHQLAARAEQAKIDAALDGHARIDLAAVEAGLASRIDRAQQDAALAAHMDTIVAAARETVRLAGISPTRVDALYFTGGSTGLASLAERIAAPFERAERVSGDRFTGVATGLGIYARRRFAGR